MSPRRRPVAARRRLALVATVSAFALVAAGLLASAALQLGPFTAPTAAAGLARGLIPAFVDDTATSGLSHTYDGPDEFAVGGGVAVLDCNDDGRLDVYLAGGEQPAGLFRNESLVGEELRFLRLNDPVADMANVNGAYPLDVDGDGHVDLITLRLGENVALRGLGDCRFERANEAWGLVGGDEVTEAFSATWEAGATWPTIAFGNYVDPDDRDIATWCQTNVLVRPAPAEAGGAGRFGPPIALEPSHCALSILFSDWDGSGRRDLRVSNDRHYYLPNVGEEQLWRVAPGEPPRLYERDEGWARVQIQGMGIASYDLTGDALPEVYLTSQAANKLQSLAEGPSRPTFADIGLPRNVNVSQPFTGPDSSLPSTAWHPEFDDVNNDGLIDLFVSKGNVADQPDFAREDPSNLLLGGPDGIFEEAADRAGILDFGRGRGAALADFNIDGRLDLVESFYGAPVRLWRNTGSVEGSPAGAPPAHWLAIRVRQPGPNRDAIGAVLDVRTAFATYRRELVVGGGHAGGELGWVHVGLGPATSAEVRVTWPDGEVGPWRPAGIDGFAYVDYPGIVRSSAGPPP